MTAAANNNIVLFMASYFYLRKYSFLFCFLTENYYFCKNNNNIINMNYKTLLLAATMTAVLSSCGATQYVTEDGQVISRKEMRDIRNQERRLRQATSGNTDDESVNVGYGETSRSGLTYSVSKLKVKQREIVTYTNIYDYLRGRVPGVVVNGDKVYIRGISTINASTDPLFIVDGVQVSDISNINPQDVDNISVLKDGSSAIYGSRGANGVIIISLKKAGSTAE